MNTTQLFNSVSESLAVSLGGTYTPGVVRGKISFEGDAAPITLWVTWRVYGTQIKVSSQVRLEGLEAPRHLVPEIDTWANVNTGMDVLAKRVREGMQKIIDELPTIVAKTSEYALRASEAAAAFRALVLEVGAEVKEEPEAYLCSVEGRLAFANGREVSVQVESRADKLTVEIARLGGLDLEQASAILKVLSR